MDENKELDENLQHIDETAVDNKDEKVGETVSEEQVSSQENIEVNEEMKSEDSTEEVKETSSEEAVPAALVNLPPDSVAGDYNGSQNLEEMKSYFKPLRYVYNIASTIDDDIEKCRAPFAKKVRNSRIVNFVCLGVMLLAFVAVLLVTLLNTNKELAWVSWTVIGISIAIIIACFIVSNILNKKTTKQVSEFFDNYEDTLNGYIAYNLHVDDALLCSEGEIDDQLVIQAHYFKTISSISSRGVMLGKRNGYEFATCEIGVTVPTISFEEANKLPTDYVDLMDQPYVPQSNENNDTSTQELPANDMTVVDLELASEVTGKKEKKAKNKRPEDVNTYTGLLGKFYSYASQVGHDEAFIVCFTGSMKNTYLPDYLAGFKAVKIPGLKHHIIVYAVNPIKISKFFDEEGIKLLNDISINTVVLSAFISINSYGMKAGLNLSDDIIEVPVKRIAHLGSYDLFKDASVNIFKFFDYVDSKKDHDENN